MSRGGVAAAVTVPLFLHTCDNNDMLMHMRTTIDIPDALMRRARPVLAKRQMTLRSLVVDALERLLQPEERPFRLRDASAGHPPGADEAVSNEVINAAIEELGEPSR